MTYKHSTNINGTLGKVCGGCKLWKSLIGFNKDKSRKDGLRCECKHCLKEYRYNNKEEIRIYKKNYQNIHKRELREYKEKLYNEFKPILTRLKINGCSICGSHINLEFHHVMPENKLFNISQCWSKSNEVLSEELDKCMLLCCKCHNKQHG